MRAVGPSGQVVAIEPDPRNRLQLENNINLNAITNATIVPLAAWSHAGKVRWQGDSAEPVWHKIDESSGSGFVDAVIQPRETRKKLIQALAMLETKRDKNPPKKHGNIPL